MKVFISWSGDLSKNIAETLRQWLPGVIQALKPYYTPDDITKGTRWNSEISKELDASKLGIICLTKDNLESPWIMFEAGALSKNIDKSKVCPILFNVELSDIQGPLIQFQAAKFSKTEMKKVVKMMNAELSEFGLAPDVLDTVFEMWWPKLQEKVEAEVKKFLQKGTPDKGDVREERDILEEILFLTRELSINKSKRKEKEESINPEAIVDMMRKAEELALEIRKTENPRLYDLFYELLRPIEYIIDSLKIDSPSFREETMYRLRRIHSIGFRNSEFPVVVKSRSALKKGIELKAE